MYHVQRLTLFMTLFYLIAVALLVISRVFKYRSGRRLVVAGFIFCVAGGLSNILVIWMNNGMMPAKTISKSSHINDREVNEFVMVDEYTGREMTEVGLKFLSDVIIIKTKPYSVGDLLIAIGSALMIFGFMRFVFRKKGAC